MNRKQRRAHAKEEERSGDKEVAEKVALFSKIPDHCLTCNKPFDKSDKQMVMEWNVVVRSDQDKVNLYCPACWARAKEFVNQLDLQKEK